MVSALDLTPVRSPCEGGTVIPVLCLSLKLFSSSEPMPERTIKDRNGIGMNPPADVFVPESRQKDSKDIRCAEIKPIPTMKNGEQDRGPRTFKIGEYNRATASFEIPSLGTTPVAELESGMINHRTDHSLDQDIIGDHYFQSSFARYVVSNQSKSLDYSVNKNSAIRNGPNSINTVNENSTNGIQGKNVERCWQIPGQENWDLRRVENADIVDEEISLLGEKLATKKLDDGKFGMMADRPGSRSSSSFLRSPSEYRDTLTSPLPASCRSSQHRSYSSASEMATVMLQSQVTTLQWQLRQAEASRQMHRAVLEQVVGFLKRTHRGLDLLQNFLPEGSTLTRVPRSRSVHSVESSSSRSSSMPRSESSASFHKAKSVAQITDPNCPKHGDAFREMTWRRNRRQHHEDELPSPTKLSEEAFRLLRTVQSLLSTREPDLTSRLNSGRSSPANVAADVSSASSTLDSDTQSSDAPFQSQDTVVHVGTKRQDELQAAFGGNCSPIPGLPAAHLKDATMSLGRRHRRRTIDVFGGNGSPPQLSSSSADDESGFSSMNSFQGGTAHCQEVGVKHMRSQCEVIHEEKRASFQEVGLPVRGEEMCKIHRRWSSTTADNVKMRNASLGNAIRVLWV